MTQPAAERQPAPTDGLRIREAARGLLLTDDEQVLLVRFEFPAATRWALPGGGIDPGESVHDALRRELLEELGLHDPAIGPHIWNRLHIIPFVNGLYDGQRDRIHLVRVPTTFEPLPAFSWEQLNAEYMYELRWWSLDEVAASSEIFVPWNLAAMVRSLIDHGPPIAPIDVDV